MLIKVIIGLFIAAGVGGGAWFWSENKAPEAPSIGMEDEQNGEAEAHSDQGGVGTFAELTARTGSWECDVITDHAEVKSSGVVRIADGEVRADYTSETNGMTIESHMIHADGYMYSWSDMMPQGVKIKVDAAETVGADTQYQGMSANTDVSYSCRPWAKDASKFAVPSTVTFMEFGAQGSVPMPLPR